MNIPSRSIAVAVAVFVGALSCTQPRAGGGESLAAPTVSSGVTPSGAPQTVDASTAKSAAVNNGGFTLNLVLGNGAYSEWVPIPIATTLTYEGAGLTAMVPCPPPPVIIGVMQLDGTLSRGTPDGPYVLDCTETTLSRGIPSQIRPFMPGMWSEDDPNLDFYLRVFAGGNDRLSLPRGQWRIFAWSFAGAAAGATKPTLEASIDIRVP